MVGKTRGGRKKEVVYKDDNGLKEIISVLEESGALTEHDNKVRAEAIDKVIQALTDSIPLVENQDIIYGFTCATQRIEQLKEQNK